MINDPILEALMGPILLPYSPLTMLETFSSPPPSPPKVLQFIKNLEGLIEINLTILNLFDQLEIKPKTPSPPHTS